jgi:hypothetical protein
VCLLVFAARAAGAQDGLPATREAAIEREQAAKVATLEPYEPNTAERWIQKGQDLLFDGGLHWHPFFENAYRGGGFALGAGYRAHVSPFNLLDVRGSYSLAGYKRVETAFEAPRLFKRRGELSLLAGWRDATEVDFFGVGNDSSKDAPTTFRFKQPYVSGVLQVRPTRNLFLLRGGLEWSQWQLQPGRAKPSVESVYTPATLPGLGATVSYLHTHATVALDSRPSPGYSRRGTYVGITAHDYGDRDDQFGFRAVDYEVIQHVPILREAWVLSLRGVASTTYGKGGQQVPFFMLPSLGGGTNLRGFGSWRYRDRQSLLLQAEWRIMVNRYLDTAFFYDAGKVAARTSDLDFDGLRSDYGFGLRFHGPFATPLRVEVARSREGTHFIFTSSAAF